LVENHQNKTQDLATNYISNLLTQSADCINRLEGKIKLGLFSAAFPQWSLDQFADWSAANGFEMLEIAC
jgi:hypothetical protein